MKISIPVASEVETAVDVISTGRIVAFPTGTSYGLAADALQGWALQRLHNLKQRDQSKTFTVFIVPQLFEEYLSLSSQEKRLISAYSGKPLTLLVTPKQPLQHLADQKTQTVGLRLIDHPLMQLFAEKAWRPLTATSANQSGEPPCYSPLSIQQAFPNPLPASKLDTDTPRGAADSIYDLSIGLILDGGTLKAQPPTTIARIHNGAIDIIRPGAIQPAELQAHLI